MDLSTPDAHYGKAVYVTHSETLQRKLGKHGSQ